MSFRGSEAQGRIEVVRDVKSDKYGDPIRWASTITYWAAIGGKRSEFRFHEDHGYPHKRGQTIAVRYNAKRPEYLVTISGPKELLGRFVGLTLADLFLYSIYVIWLVLR